MKTMKKLTCVICLALGLLAPLQVQAENDQNANVGREVVVKYKNIERVSTTLQIQSDSAVCRVSLNYS